MSTERGCAPDRDAARPGTTCFAGLDGGGTQTVCIVYCPETGALGLGRGGPLNPNYVPLEEARASVRDALCQALEQANAAAGDLRCLAAASPWAEELVRRTVSALAAGARVVTPGEDAVALLGGALRDHGLVLIAGTGSRCAYLPPGGGEAVVSGAWGSLFGDEGSGYDIGRRTLQAVTRAWDGRGPDTALAGLVSDLWSLREPKELVRAVYSAGPGAWRRRIASICPLVGRAAEGGDRVAGEILDQAAAELALLVESVVVRAGLARPVRVLLSGGVFALGELIVYPLARRLAENGTAIADRPLFPPVCGALFAAIAAGTGVGPVRPDPGLAAGLRRVLSPGGGPAAAPC